MIYKEFAEFYDELFDPEMYNGWFQYLTNSINQNSSILDLACGNGKLAIMLAKDNYKVSGADLSGEMLSIADQHAREAQVTIPFYELDMRNLSAIGNYDVITCFDDSLNYLLNLKDLELVFSEVASHLNPKGKFLFDVITPYQANEVYPGYMYNYRDDERIFMWTSYAGEFAKNSVEHELTFLMYNEQKDAFDEYNELHQEVTFEVEAYQELLKKVGFKDINITTNFGKDPYEKNIKRWFFECQL